MDSFVYQPKGVCSHKMTFHMEGDYIMDVEIEGGCAGNLLGISRLIKNKKINHHLHSGGK